MSLIVLANKCGGIAKKNGSLPFINKYDMINFVNKTKNNITIMGSNTWKSLPDKYKPLPDRMNVIISSQGNKILQNNKNFLNSNSIKIFKNIDDCIKYFPKFDKNKKLYIIGGSTIYNEFLKKNMISKICFTEMVGNDDYPVKINLTMDKLLSSSEWYKLKDNELDIHSFDNKYKMELNYKNCRYNEFIFQNIEEKNFLDRLKLILSTGYKKSDRTGTGTLSLFSPGDLSFSLKDNTIPLLTTRQLPLRHIFEELIWFLRGQTDVKILQRKGINIWNDNTNKEFLDKRGLNTYPEWDLGPSYSFQFRYSGAQYNTCKDSYHGKGFDQLNYVIGLLKNNPDSRRIIINLWNPSDLDKMSIGPCGFCYQFYVTPDKELITKITQRSSDIALAGGWNIASASLLTYMLSSVCGLKPHSVIWSTGDTHIYLNQIDGVKEQLSRKLYMPFPKLYLNDNAPSLLNNKDITEFEYSDFSLINYNPQKKINFAMNA
jgi:thymidylate synthase